MHERQGCLVSLGAEGGEKVDISNGSSLYFNITPKYAF